MQLPGMHLIRRSLAEHMQDGDGRFARYLESEIVAVAARHNRVSAGVFTGQSSFATRHPERADRRNRPQVGT